MEDAADERRTGDDLARWVEVLSQAIAQAAIAVECVRRALGDASDLQRGDRGRSDPAVRAAVGAIASSSQTSRRSASAPRRSQYSREVSRALRYIEAHYEEEISLARLARVAGCSRRHLADLVRRETGETVHGHLVRVRLDRAALHVRAGDKIEAVMLGVGYRGKRNFYRQFKAQFGVTPCAYRQRIRADGVAAAQTLDSTPASVAETTAAAPDPARSEPHGDDPGWPRL